VAAATDLLRTVTLLDPFHTAAWKLLATALDKDGAATEAAAIRSFVAEMESEETP
jgi:cytochrome c-type biogenesis protein CcmH/NrfG